MSLWKIAWRSIQQRSLASLLTGFSMALGVALVVAVLVIHNEISDSFGRAAGGYHLLVGKKGSSLQLVMNSVYFLQDPIENLPYSFYTDFLDTPKKHGRFASSVAVAIPYCLGDNYEGFRVVGTTPELFEKFEYTSGRKYEIQPPGRNIKSENFFEAVIGATVARETGLKAGDEFRPTHGLSNEGDGHKHDAFKVVGVLRPTGTPNDRALFINIEGFYLLDKHAKPMEEVIAREQEAHHADETETHHDVHDPAHEGESPAEHADEHSADSAAHDAGAIAVQAAGEHADEHGDGDHDEAHHHEPLPEAQREVTTILVLASDDILARVLATTINEGEVAQAVFPVSVMDKIFRPMVETVHVLLLVLTVLIVLVAAIGIMVSIYNSMNDRRREIAVMRSLGAGRGTVMAIILLESVLLSLSGGLVGVVMGHGLIALAGPWVLSVSGVSLGILQFVWHELVLIPGLILLAAAAGFLPALTAYRTDVAKVLSTSP